MVCVYLLIRFFVLSALQRIATCFFSIQRYEIKKPWKQNNSFLFEKIKAEKMLMYIRICKSRFYPLLLHRFLQKSVMGN